MNNNQPYSSSDIQRYISGQMSAEEMNALEKAALEDPFLSDAIEGYASRISHGKADMHADLTDLSTRLKARLGEDDKRVAVPLFKWWKAAAVIVLLAGAGVLAYTLLNTSQQHKTLAKNEAVVTVPPSLEDTLAGNIISLNEPAAGILERNDEQLPALPQKNDRASGNKVSVNETVENSKMIPSEKRSLRRDKPEQDQNTKDVEQEVIREQMASVSVRQTSAPSVKEVAPKSFSGKIVDENNKPVPYASVLVINSELGVSTDSNGRFDFSYNDSVATVDVSTTGFESARATLRTGSANIQIKLQRSSNTNDETIAAVKSRTKNAVTSTESITTTSTGIEPVSGWAEYNSYIAKNKRKPSGREDVPEEVVLSFAIDNSGRAVQIHIEKPASPASNAEAVRLLKEGAAWKNNQQIRAVVTIRL